MAIRQPRIEQTIGQEGMTNRIQRSLSGLHSDVQNQFDNLSAADISYTPTTAADWVAPVPTTLQEAIDRLAAAAGAHPVP